GLILFLTGRDAELLRGLRQQMTEASDRREYERAARLRDQIAHLESARTPQSVVLPGALDTDVVGVSRHADRAAVATLVVRGGRVIGKETRILERAGALEDAELLRQVIVQHYLGRAELPRRIVVAQEPSDCDATREAL